MQYPNITHAPTSLLDWRISKKMTQAQAASTLDISVSTYNALEQRKNRPSAQTLYRLCKVTGLSIGQVLGEE